MLEDLWKERNLWRRLERERERGGIWGKERFYDRWFEDKNVEKSLGGCIKLIGSGYGANNYL